MVAEGFVSLMHMFELSRSLMTFVRTRSQLEVRIDYGLMKNMFFYLMESMYIIGQYNFEFTNHSIEK